MDSGHRTTRPRSGHSSTALRQTGGLAVVVAPADPQAGPTLDKVPRIGYNIWMGPRLIVDKSALQMIGREAFDEMTLWFDIVATPTLVRELISNHNRTNPVKKGRRLPEDVLHDISSLLARSHAVIPASFRSLAVNDLVGKPVVMNGVTVPLDGSAGNVHSGGGMLALDGTKDQELFAGWARGEFRETDARVAHLWRSGVAALDMKAIGEQVKPFAKRVGVHAKNINAVVECVDAFLANPDRQAQLDLCSVLLTFLREDHRYASRFQIERRLKNGLLLRDFAPYAASILRIYLVFIVALGLELVRRDSNSLADLQYLFYAPFCTAFCSNDKLHEKMFAATNGPAIFLQAETLKADLLQRKEWRETLGDDGWTKHKAEYGIYPMEFDGSLINDVWNRTMNPRPATPNRVTRESLDKVQNDPEFWGMVDRMKTMVAESEAAKEPEETAWPHGQFVARERPL